MIRQCLSNKNENATVSQNKNFWELNKASVLCRFGIICNNLYFSVFTTGVFSLDLQIKWILPAWARRAEAAEDSCKICNYAAELTWLIHSTCSFLKKFIPVATGGSAEGLQARGGRLGTPLNILELGVCPLYPLLLYPLLLRLWKHQLTFRCVVIGRTVCSQGRGHVCSWGWRRVTLELA